MMTTKVEDRPVLWALSKAVRPRFGNNGALNLVIKKLHPKYVCVNHTSNGPLHAFGAGTELHSKDVDKQFIFNVQ